MWLYGAASPHRELYQESLRGVPSQELWSSFPGRGALGKATPQLVCQRQACTTGNSKQRENIQSFYEVQMPKRGLSTVDACVQATSLRKAVQVKISQLANKDSTINFFRARTKYLYMSLKPDQPTPTLVPELVLNLEFSFGSTASADHLSASPLNHLSTIHIKPHYKMTTVFTQTSR